MKILHVVHWPRSGIGVKGVAALNAMPDCIATSTVDSNPYMCCGGTVPRIAGRRPSLTEGRPAFRASGRLDEHGAVLLSEARGREPRA